MLGADRSFKCDAGEREEIIAMALAHRHCRAPDCVVRPEDQPAPFPVLWITEPTKGARLLATCRRGIAAEYEHQPRHRRYRRGLVRDAAAATKPKRGQFLGAFRCKLPCSSARRDVSVQAARTA